MSREDSVYHKTTKSTSFSSTLGMLRLHSLGCTHGLQVWRDQRRAQTEGISYITTCCTLVSHRQKSPGTWGTTAKVLAHSIDDYRASRPKNASPSTDPPCCRKPPCLAPVIQSVIVGSLSRPPRCGALPRLLQPPSLLGLHQHPCRACHRSGTSWS